MEEGLKNVEVPSANLSAVDLVEDLQEYESVEDVGEMFSLCLTLFI